MTASRIAAPSPPATGPMTPAMFRVVDKVHELHDTVTLALSPRDEPIDAPSPGQFNMLWAFGIGEAPISLSRIDGAVLWHTIRAVGAVTRALAAAEIGDEIGVRGPFGRGWTHGESAGTHLLVAAGGLGLAPLRPAIEASIQNGERVTVLVGARDRDNLLFEPELGEWRNRGADVEITLDAASPRWHGHVGVVTRLVERAEVDTELTTTLVCGPEVMMRFTAAALERRGVRPEAIQVSLERNMHCAVGHCGHCQLGPMFVCKDGPVVGWPDTEPLLRVPHR